MYNILLKKIFPVFLLLVLSVQFTGCLRGKPSDKPPIHINPNMDQQPKYLPQTESRFFENGSAMRAPVPGTVARGELFDDTEYYFGKDAAGNLILKSPIDPTVKVLKRGQERYDIYCAPCHSRVGDGKGIVVKRGYLPPPSFHQDNIRNFPDGHIYDVISNGIRNMPSYKHQIPVDDRWAIVNYVRALQRARNASASDVPEEILKDLN
ncbi:MAG: cytochrome c [Calditrichaceae bacterium]